MAPQIDTAQRRAEAARRLIGIIDGLAYIDPNDHIKCERAIVQFLETYDPQARREALEDAAKVCREFSKGYDMEWWRETPKTEVYKTACLEMIAQIDRLREGVEG